MRTTQSVIPVLAAALAVIAGTSPAVGAASANGTIAESQGGGRRIQPCKLLTDAQVRTVLPNLKGSYVAADGDSLVQGLTSYQCSYVDSTALQSLIVIITVAADDKSFESIRRRPGRSEGEKADVGDAAWLWASGGKLNLTVLKGRAVIELTLDVPGAAGQSKALLEVGRLVTAAIG